MGVKPRFPSRFFSLLGPIVMIAVVFGCMPTDTPADSPTDTQVDMPYIKAHIRLGLSQDQVKQLLGDEYAVVAAAMDDSQMWRYDFPAKAGYRFEAEDGMDSVDIHGLKTGAMNMQLFVDWTGWEGGVLFTALQARRWYTARLLSFAYWPRKRGYDGVRRNQKRCAVSGNHSNADGCLFFSCEKRD